MNFPRKSALDGYYSQLIRFASINSSYQAFRNKSRSLIDKLSGQGYRLEELNRSSLRFFKDRSNILVKYGPNNGNDFIKDLFQ